MSELKIKGTKRYCPELAKYFTTAKVDEFFEEYNKLCLKYNMALAHEDGHGAFEITEYDEYLIDWANAAHVSKKLIK